MSQTRPIVIVMLNEKIGQIKLQPILIGLQYKTLDVDGFIMMF